MDAHRERTTEEFPNSGSPEVVMDTSLSELSCDRGGVSHGGKRHGLHHSRYTREAGQELVEFALAIFLLALFVFGAADLARIFHGLVVITNAAREGARYGVTHYGMFDLYDPNLSNCEKVPNSATYSKAGYKKSIICITQQEAKNSGIDLSSSTIMVDCTWVSDPTLGDVCKRTEPIRVTVIYQVDIFMKFILPDQTLTRYAEMMIP